MPECIYRTEFQTKIGRLYCLWEKRDGEVIVLFLGTGKEYFIQVIKKIEDNRNTLEKTLIKSRKSRDIEEKITGYLDGRIKNINFKFDFLIGTAFQKKIWTAAASIPCGKTAGYKEVAELAGFKKAWRAAGTALKKNPILLIIPCHRVIKSNGDFGEFGGGDRLEGKKFLIELERSQQHT
jgi:O-6-methylguanine DNA methyltransferase